MLPGFYSQKNKTKKMVEHLPIPYNEYKKTINDVLEKHNYEVRRLKYDRYVWAAWSAAITLASVFLYIYIKPN